MVGTTLCTLLASPFRAPNFERGRLGIGFLVLLWVVAGQTANAQRLDGTLRLEVTDSSGAAVVDAKVTVTNEATNVALSSDRADSGIYVFPNLLPGAYRLVIEKQGFQKLVRPGVTVEANLTSEAKVKLEPGSVETTIEVQAGADLVKTTSSELGSTIGGRAANELPIGPVGGSVLELATLLPNTTTQQGGVLGSGGSIGGMRPRFNSFTIDGADDNRLDVNGPTQPVIQDSVAEFTLLTNEFGAEYGHSAGGQFAITTKSGTNSWHGDAWLYNRNRNYNGANNLEKDRIASGVASDKDRFDNNRAGADMGGPILKNKLFLYGAYEFLNVGLASSSPTVTVPTAAGFSQLQAFAPNSAVAAVLEQFPVAPVSNGLAHCKSSPSDTQAELACVNGTAVDVGTFQSVAPNFFNEHDFTVNADATLGKHQLRGRVLYDRQRSPDFNASQPQTQFLGTVAADARKIIFTDGWAISSTVVNDFRTSYSRLIGPKVLIPAAFADFPNVEVDELGTNVGPDQVAPQSYQQNTYQWLDTVTKVKGHHTVKGGIEFRKYISSSDFLPRSRGEWDYATLGSLINDLVPDGGNGALRGAGNGNSASNYNAFYTFLQDDWRILPRLTLNLGLRYEYTGVPRDEALQAINAISDDPALGLIFRTPKSDVNNFAPRAGFAWDVAGNGKWAIRGGAGVSYDVLPNNFAINSLPPQLQSEQNPTLTCALSGAPAWCTNGGNGFLLNGGLLSVNVPPANQADARAATQSFIQDYVAPKVFNWSLGVQRQILRDTKVEVLYLGTKGLSLPAQIRLNSASAFDPSVPGGGIAPLPTYFSASDVPAAVPAPASTLADFQAFNPRPLSVDGFFGSVTTFLPAGQSIYHSGSVDVTHRMAKNLYLRANYTFAKTIDNATNELFSSRVNPRRPQDARDLSNERGRSALDIPHKLAVSWIYDLPLPRYSNRLARGLLEGWTYAGSYLAESGQPVTALSGVDSNGNGDSAGDRTILNPSGTGLTGTAVNPVCNAGPGGATYVGACDAAHTVGYVAVDSTARFVQAGAGARANVGRDTIGTPGLNIWNMAILKKTQITERVSLQFRAETYNTFNHRNFSIGLPSNSGALDSTTNPNPLSAGYPFVTATGLFLNSHQFNGGSRTMQLGVKVAF
jgi:Carboxypeptidase regulatory-like domain/TonB dependent receptor